ncbi:MAG: glycosyltransferase family 2 protein [Planctomycetaceae bacterium]|jgi:glycosyltransferase involved in cell wall biosynthesis|nr:glycosyltransferase family 2 protein [Planctomycetaceae bacterium]
MPISENGVSVIIPVYNREKYLEECIKSVTTQECDFPVEIIIADDGSTDKSKEVALSFGDSVIWLDKPVDCQTQGCGSTRNRGIEAAAYSMIAFLDSDDYFLPGHLQRCYNYLRNNPDISMVIDQLYSQEGNNNKNKWLRIYPEKDEVQFKTIFLDCYIPSNLVVLRKSLFDKVGGLYDVEAILSEDYDLWLRAFEQGERMMIIEGGGAVVREHGGRSIRSIRKTYESAEFTMNKAIKRYPYPADWIRKRKAVFQFRYAQCDFADKKFFSAFRRLLYALLLDPVRAIKLALNSVIKLKRNNQDNF